MKDKMFRLTVQEVVNDKPTTILKSYDFGLTASSINCHDELRSLLLDKITGLTEEVVKAITEDKNNPLL